MICLESQKQNAYPDDSREREMMFGPGLRREERLRNACWDSPILWLTAGRTLRTGVTALETHSNASTKIYTIAMFQYG
jgi:hypothetical protein